MSQSFELPMPSGRTVRGIVDRANRPGPRPTVVICHGFKGFQEWGFFPYLATLLTERGFTAVRFNFPGNGMLPGDELVTDLEAFRTARPSADLEDLEALLDRLADVDPERIDAGRLGLIGHSRGGGLAILASAQEPIAERLGAMVSWSAVATFDRLDSDEKAEWRRAGEVTIVNGRTGQELPLGAEVLDDIENHATRLDIEAAAAARTAPWLIVHGDCDETVPVAEARRLQRAARGPVELHEITASGHTFEVGHPFSGPSPQLIEAMNATQTWFRRHLE